MSVPGASGLLPPDKGVGRDLLSSLWTPGALKQTAPYPCLPSTGLAEVSLQTGGKYQASFWGNSDPKVCLQPRLLQVPRRFPGKQGLLFSVPQMTVSRKPCQLGKAFSTLEHSKPCQRYKGPEKYRKTTPPWDFFLSWFWKRVFFPVSQALQHLNIPSI